MNPFLPRACKVLTSRELLAFINGQRVPAIKGRVATWSGVDDELLVCRMTKVLRPLTLQAIESRHQRALAYIRAGLTRSAEEDRKLAALDRRALAYARLDPHRAGTLANIIDREAA